MYTLNYYLISILNTHTYDYIRRDPAAIGTVPQYSGAIHVIRSKAIELNAAY